MRSDRWSWTWNVVGALLSLCPGPFTLQAQTDAPADADAVLATVDGQAIRQSDLEFLCLVRGLSPDTRNRESRRLVEELIDQRLMMSFLKSRQTEASPEELDARIASIRGLIARSGRDPEEVLAKLGVDETALRRTLALPLAWNRHVQRTVTAGQLAERFQQHRQRYDGTQLRVSQIVFPLAPETPGPERESQRQKLEAIRTEIAAGTTTFAAAAREHSRSPAAASGGDLGWITYGARLPRELADQAFQLQPGAVTPVVESRFGLHLLTVTESKPGVLTQEDVRPELLEDLGRELWAEQVQQSRATSTIQVTAREE